MREICLRGFTAVRLLGFVSLDLSDEDMISLRAEEFGGMHRLQTLDLASNSLESLPAGVFDELYELRTLLLNDNDVALLPEGLFDDLSRFKNAHLGRQFSGLDRLRQSLTERAPATVETFIEALPQLQKERFVFVYNSGGLGADSVSSQPPRVVTPGADGRFIFAWPSDPDAPDPFRDSVELLIPATTAWTWGITDFSGAGEPGSARPHLRDGGVVDSAGLEQAAYLKEPDPSGNAVADLSALAGLTQLRVLGLARVTADLRPLWALTTLHHLSLCDPRLSDIAAPACPSGLEVLDLSGNPVTDLWPLSGLVGLKTLRLNAGTADDTVLCEPSVLKRS